MKLDQTADGKIASAVAHQGGNVELLDAEDCTGTRLGQSALLDDLIDSQSELGLQQFLLWIWQTEISEDIAATLLCSNFGFIAHIKLILPRVVVSFDFCPTTSNQVSVPFRGCDPAL